MKLTGISFCVLSGLIISCAPINAQQSWYVPQIDETRTPIEKILQSDLAMPGLGIDASRAKIIKRFEYAMEHKWLSAGQVGQLCNDLKGITDREQSQRDSNGKLSFEARASLAKRLNELNERFEDMVLVKEQSSAGMDGLLARRAAAVKRINKAEEDGKISSKKSLELKNEIAAAMASLPSNGSSDEATKKVSSSLNEISSKIDGQLQPSSLANRTTQSMQ